MTSIRDAIKQWEATEGAVAAEAEDIRLCPVALSTPCITKMDGARARGTRGVMLGAEGAYTSPSTTRRDVAQVPWARSRR